MKKVSEYRQHARECRDMAARTTDPNQRSMLLNMAETWMPSATIARSTFPGWRELLRWKKATLR
jgi:hypothetical protein